MNVLVVGAGITGCTLARLMKDKGHKVFIIERLNHIGGLSHTEINKHGLLYGPYGAHVFHTSDKRIIQFIQQFGKFNSYVHHKGIIINGIIRPYPLSLETINNMPEKEIILKELKEKPRKANKSNFEQYLISLIGPTLYNLYVYNYTKKMWGIEPRDLTTEWVPKRIELRKSNIELFKDQWQGLPIEGYNKLLLKMIAGIPIEYNQDNFNEYKYDLVLFSGRIDELLGFKFGILPYRSLRFEYREDELWENEMYGTINLPQHPKFIRKANFKILYQQKTNHSLIQYQEPVPAAADNPPMYPVKTRENSSLFDKYLNEVCKSEKLIPVGRLGLYKYLDMDKAISLSMEMIPLIEEWKELNPKSKIIKIKDLIKKY